MSSGWDPSDTAGGGYDPPRYDPPGIPGGGGAGGGDYGISFGANPSQAPPPPPGQAPPPGQVPPPGQAPPPGPPPGSPGFGYNPSGYPVGVAPPVEHPQGTTILVLGILSLVVCGVLGPFAWVMGNNAMKEIKRSHRPVSNRGAVQAGRICGMISSIIMVLAVVLILIIVVLRGEASQEFRQIPMD